MEIICNFGVRKNDKIYLNDSSNQYLHHNNYFKTIKGRYYKQKEYWIFNIKNLSKHFSQNDINKIIVADIKKKTNEINDKEGENNDEEDEINDKEGENNDEEESNSNEKIDNSSQTYSDYFVESEYSLNLKQNISEEEKSENISEDNKSEIIMSESEDISENSNHLKNYLDVEGGYTSKYNDNMSKISDITNASREIYEEQKKSNVFNTEYIMHKNINIISEYEIKPDDNLYSYVKKYIEILK
tara:strand:+ start:3612 stop:4340 length:729 start_codon:yes stop_codon:yes gene_type:complete